MALDTAALIESLELGPCHLVGYSLGGFIAEELCYLRPELVRDVVLMASAGRASSSFAATCKRRWTWQRLLIRPQRLR